MRVKACVLTYRETAMLRRCLASIEGVDEVEVFFNGSDGEAERGFGLPGVTVISSVENLAFAAVVNRAIERAAGFDALLFVTNDIEFERGAVKRLIECLVGHPECGLIGPLQMKPGGFGIHHAGGEFDKKRWKAEVETDVPDHEGDVVYRWWVDGAAMLIRLDAMKETRRMEERMGFYWEDVAWGFAFDDSEWDIAICPAAKAVHSVGGSTGRFGRWREFMIARNRALSLRLFVTDSRYGKIAQYLRFSAIWKLVRKGFREKEMVYWAGIREGLAGRFEETNLPLPDDDPIWTKLLRF